MQKAEMTRRDSIAALLAMFFAGRSEGLAQQGKVWRIGYLTPAGTSSPGDAALLHAFTDQLEKLGYAEGRNLAIIHRAAEGNNGRLNELANELVTLNPDAIIAIATPAIAAAQKATSTIPIVMTPATDPVGSGFVKSLSHPGGNITGTGNMFGDLTDKSVGLLHVLVPSAKKVAVLMSTNPTHKAIFEATHSSAQEIGLETVPILAKTSDDLENAFQEMGKAGCDILFVMADPIRPKIVDLAARAQIPTLYQFAEYVEMGGLVSYGPSLPELFRRSARYVDAIFKGADPGNLPVAQPTVFELVLNLKTARQLNLLVPDSLTVRADRIIE